MWLSVQFWLLRPRVYPDVSSVELDSSGTTASIANF